MGSASFGACGIRPFSFCSFGPPTLSVWVRCFSQSLSLGIRVIPKGISFGVTCCSQSLTCRCKFYSLKLSFGVFFQGSSFEVNSCSHSLWFGVYYLSQSFSFGVDSNPAPLYLGFSPGLLFWVEHFSRGSYLGGFCSLRTSLLGISPCPRASHLE